MNIVVFLGPTLSRADAESLLPGAVYLPPARHSDVLSVLGTHHPDVIGLIDGSFEQSMSVWHKEILFALERGVQVWGAASMGAQRAAELHPFGMRGVGTIFEYYSSSGVTDDDEVAVLHGPAETSFGPLTEPMVNLRATFGRAYQQAVISAADAERLVQTAKRLHYSRRTLATILETATVTPPVADAVAAFFATEYVDVKAADARLLLGHLAGDAHSESVDRPQPVRSRAFQEMLDSDRRVQHEGYLVSLRDIAAHAALQHQDFDAVNFAALNQALVQELAAQMGVSANEDDVAAERDRFMRDRGLTDANLKQWLNANDLSAVEFSGLVREKAVCRRMHRWLLHTPRGTRQTRWLLDELRNRDTYAATADGAAAIAAAVDGDGAFEESLSELDGPAVLKLVADRPLTGRWRTLAELAYWAEEAGFKSLKDLGYALLHERRASDSRRENVQR